MKCYAKSLVLTAVLAGLLGVTLARLDAAAFTSGASSIVLAGEIAAPTDDEMMRDGKPMQDAKLMMEDDKKMQDDKSQMKPDKKQMKADKKKMAAEKKKMAADKKRMDADKKMQDGKQ
jgi:hypothetical protein